MNEPTLLDIFSGIGGFSLAFESVGFRTIGFSEIDSYASRVLAKHWPAIPNFGDVKNITANIIGTVDVVAGGFPCQPFSAAGKKRGDHDERFLWPECVRILREIRPTFALFENVPGLLAIDGGRTFNRILSDISALRYDCLWNLVPACAVGANHERDRVWLLAYAKETECSGTGNSRTGRLGPANGSSDVAHTDQSRSQGWFGEQLSECSSQWIARTSNPLGNAKSEQVTWKRSNGFQSITSQSGWWELEPDVGRVANGVSSRLDRLKCLGNSIVPQVARIFAEGIYRLLRP